MLPTLADRWVRELLEGPAPEENTATCDDCVMVPREGHDAGLSFHPRAKCCTYLPELPNFLVGAILADDDPAAARGGASVRARVAAGVAVTPLGLGRSRLMALTYRHGGEALFGRSLALRCPHYVDGDGGANCGIWRHRNAVCATFFCKHDRGAVGLRFWGAVRALLTGVEGALAQWCVVQLDLDDEAVERALGARAEASRDGALDAAELDGRADPAAHAKLWGAWAGREEAFYGACAALVAPLAWTDVLRICGPEVALRARLTRGHLRALRTYAAPAVARNRRLTVIPAGPGTARIETYSAYDPLVVPDALPDVLRRFDGRPTKEVLAGLADEGVELDEALIQRLLDFEVLRGDDEPAG